MEYLNLTMEEYDDLMLGKELCTGSYGKIIEYKSDMLLKMYRDKYMSISYSLDNDIEKTKENYLKELNDMKSKMEILSKTKMHDLFRGIVTYDNYLIGIIMTYYKDYVTLNEIKDKLSQEKKDIVFKNVEDVLTNLIDNGCYPMDLRYKNTLVRSSDLDVKLINLDDILTPYSFNIGGDVDKESIKQKCLSYKKDISL